jgi:hypothetical protein
LAPTCRSRAAYRAAGDSLIAAGDVAADEPGKIADGTPIRCASGRRFPKGRLKGDEQPRTPAMPPIMTVCLTASLVTDAALPVSTLKNR